MRERGLRIVRGDYHQPFDFALALTDRPHPEREYSTKFEAFIARLGEELYITGSSLCCGIDGSSALAGIRAFGEIGSGVTFIIPHDESIWGGCAQELTKTLDTIESAGYKVYWCRSDPPR